MSEQKSSKVNSLAVNYKTVGVGKNSAKSFIITQQQQNQNPIRASASDLASSSSAGIKKSSSSYNLTSAPAANLSSNVQTIGKGTFSSRFPALSSIFSNSKTLNVNSSQTHQLQQAIRDSSAPPSRKSSFSAIKSPLLTSRQASDELLVAFGFHPVVGHRKHDSLRYKNLLEDAMKANQAGEFEEFENLHWVYLGGKDEDNRPILIIAAKRVVQNDFCWSESQMLKALKYLIWKIHEQVSEEYNLVFCNTDVDIKASKFFRWASRIHAALPRPYKKNIHRLFILHPNDHIKAYYNFMKPFLKARFWDKLVFLEDVFALESHLDSISLEKALPIYVLQHGKHDSPLYGASLSVGISRSRSNHRIPTPVLSCGEFLREKAMVIENIFLRDGTDSVVKKIIRSFDSNEEILLIREPYAVGTAFKQYFATLPSPLISYNAAKKWNDIFNSGGENPNEELILQEINQAIQELMPESHYLVLRYVCDLLTETSRYEKMTKMNYQSLSAIFAPILIPVFTRKSSSSNSDSFSVDAAVQLFQNFLNVYTKLPKPHLRSNSEESPDEGGPQLLKSPDIVDVSDELDAEVWIENEDFAAAAEGDVDGLFFDEFNFVCLPIPISNFDAKLT